MSGRNPLVCATLLPPGPGAAGSWNRAQRWKLNPQAPGVGLKRSWLHPPQGRVTVHYGGCPRPAPGPSGWTRGSLHLLALADGALETQVCFLICWFLSCQHGKTVLVCFQDHRKRTKNLPADTQRSLVPAAGWGTRGPGPGGRGHPPSWPFSTLACRSSERDQAWPRAGISPTPAGLRDRKSVV